MKRTIIHDGDLARIVAYDTDPTHVYKLAGLTAQAFLDNERAAYDFISTLASVEFGSVILPVDTNAADTSSKKPAIKGAASK